MTRITERSFLKTGEEYKESLRDDREVWYRGERIQDVTKHPLTAAGIAWNARLYDAQHAPETRDVLSWVRPDGARVPTAWLVPRTREDLARKRAESEYRFWESFGGLMGRQPHHLAWDIIGCAAYASVFNKHSPQYAGNIERYIQYAQEHNLHLAGVVIEPQGVRARSSRAGEDRSAVMRVVRRGAEGIWIRGAKAVGTAAPQAHELLVGCIAGPQVRPDEAFWAVVPVNSPGLRLICREGVAETGARAGDHPLAQVGEEVDAFAIFDDVFVPSERIFGLDAPALCDPALFGAIGRGEFWTHLVRGAVKAEVFAGAAQLVVDTLETGDIQGVRDQVAQLSEYAGILRGGVIAAEQLAQPTEEGVLLPDGASVSCFRTYGLSQYPRMVQLLQELCGQGLVMRFPAGDFDHPVLGPQLALYLDNARVSARDKNHVMNFIWDLTSGSLAGRTQVFENVQGYPAALLRQVLYFIVDRGPAANRLRSLIGLKGAPATPKP
jgi:4-hydroxyphenylacetate 3-monooxygenase